ncbi:MULTISPECIES: M48 family metallopeptidase [unclassified Deinococcus]|uniref:M48 family metallopeptidase n=1 Tax=unclassified Deinococcus TaxID=2623546 RepID=UPI001C30A855|nr:MULTISPECIES: SprT family zinc-dependent metalloprotease [unclassified Deinococcus]MDK2013992.1 SprT family zinc-dependent metalloprotease [Deinococcus sp. 43]
MNTPRQDQVTIGDLHLTVIRKAVKNVHLSVHPPDGRVTLVAPVDTRLDVARAYAISKLRWIEQQQHALQAQVRETPRAFITRESHYVWGRRYLLRVQEADRKPSVTLDHRHLTLTVRPGTSPAQRAQVIHDWHKGLLRAAAEPMIAAWEDRLGVRVRKLFLQRMKTRWGSCSPQAGHIRLNTELVKKPKDLLEYVVIHELIHLIDPTHGERFLTLLNEHVPTWREARAELNELPLRSEEWPSAPTG